MIRIVIADPVARVRSALRMRLELETDMSVTAECASLACAESEVARGAADVLVVDLVVADAVRTPAAAWLRDTTRACGVVVLSMDDRLGRLAGPSVEFVSKYADESAVVDAVRRVASPQVPDQRGAPASGTSSLGPRT